MKQMVLLFAVFRDTDKPGFQCKEDKPRNFVNARLSTNRKMPTETMMEEI